MGGTLGSATVVGGGFSLCGGLRVVVVLGVAGVGLCLGGNLVFPSSSSMNCSSVSINLGLRVVNEGKECCEDCRTCARSSSLLGSLPLAGRTGGGKRLF